MQAVKQHGLEGVIAKRLDSPYQSDRRSDFWLKLPLKPSQEFVIGAYRLDGKRLELLLVGYFESKKLLFAGKVHQGLNPANRRELFKTFSRWLRRNVRSQTCQPPNRGIGVKESPLRKWEITCGYSQEPWPKSNLPSGQLAVFCSTRSLSGCVTIKIRKSRSVKKGGRGVRLLKGRIQRRVFEVTSAVQKKRQGIFPASQANYTENPNGLGQLAANKPQTRKSRAQ
jgi:hypothetical protein